MSGLDTSSVLQGRPSKDKDVGGMGGDKGCHPAYHPLDQRLPTSFLLSRMYSFTPSTSISIVPAVCQAFYLVLNVSSK